MTYIPEERRQIDVGDEFFLVTYSRSQGTIYDGPHPVTKVTATQFSFGGQRYMRSSGHKVGSRYGNRAERATAEKKAEATKNRKERARMEKAKNKQASVEEMAKREKYGATHIDHDGCQKLLAAVRLKAEIGERMMSDLLGVTENASIEEPWNLYRELQNYGLGEKFALGVLLHDEATTLHQRLVHLYEGLVSGKTIKVRYNYDNRVYFDGVADALKVMKIAITLTRRRLETEFFNHRYDDDDAKHRAEWIKAMRDIEGIDNDYPSISVVKEEG